MPQASTQRINTLETVFGFAGTFLIVVSWALTIIAGGRAPEQFWSDPAYLSGFGLIAVAGAMLLYPVLRIFGARALTLICLGVVLNLIPMVLVDVIAAPVYFAVGGSAFAGFAAGPLAGMSVGVLTTLLGAFVAPDLIPHVTLLVLPGALIWFVLIEGWSSTPKKLFIVGFLVATTSSAIMIVTRVMLGGEIGHDGAANLNYFFELVLNDPLQALVLQTVVTQMLDKFLLLLVGFVGFNLAMRHTAVWKLCLREPARTICLHIAKDSARREVATPTDQPAVRTSARTTSTASEGV